MSFSNNPAARGGLHGWITAGGHNRTLRSATGGRSLAGKIYLPVDPANPSTAQAGDDTAEAVASKLPEAASPRAEGQSGPPIPPINADSKTTRPNLRASAKSADRLEILRGAPGTCQYIMRLDGRQKECGCLAAYKGRARPFLLYCKLHGEFVSRSFEVVALDGSGTSLKPWRVNGRNPSSL